MSKGPGRGGRPGPGRASQPAGGAVQAAVTARRRRRRGRWITAGAAAVVLAAVAAVIAAAADRGGNENPAAGGALPAAGAPAPGGSFTTVSGQTRTVSSLRGRPALLWLVTTWCPGCQAGTQAMAADLAGLRARGIAVVELEDYADLGQPGPAMGSFGPRYAGAAYHSPGWLFGTASQALTTAYDPQGYLDIYYLLDASGHVRYASSAPASTMPQLLAHAAGLS